MTAPSCGAAGRLTASFVGTVQADVNWINTQMTCESMPRPDGAGMRLRFSGEVKGERLAIIVAIPELTSPQAAGEMPSNVTATIEGSGRFFSTPDLDTCWTDILTQRAAGDLGGFHMVEGTLSCIAPLSELNGDGAVMIAEMSFNGIVDWSDT